MGSRFGSSLHTLWPAGATLCQPLLDLLDDMTDEGHRLLL
jgi:hypothetical protein